MVKIRIQDVYDRLSLEKGKSIPEIQRELTSGLEKGLIGLPYAFMTIYLDKLCTDGFVSGQEREDILPEVSKSENGIPIYEYLKVKDVMYSEKDLFLLRFQLSQF